MKLCELFEAKDKEEKLLPVDSIAMMLFKQKAGIVTDPKRDKDKKFIGVAHERSIIKSSSGKPLSLTFDNSTDSGEFEIDSLTPLKISKGDDLDKEIKKLFSKYELDVKKGTSYMVKSDSAYLRGIHLGAKIGSPAVKLVAELIKILKKAGGDDKDTPEEDLKKDASSDKKVTK